METTSTTGSFSKNCYDNANEAFANENYRKAVEMYGEALGHDPFNVDYLCARAHAYIKIEEFEKAKIDANKAIGNQY
jgi:tetratricopeptide (TPR) repeat protein